MKNILIVCPTPRDLRELDLLNLNKTNMFLFYDYICEDIKSFITKDPKTKCVIPDPEESILSALEFYKNKKLDGIFSTDDYPGTIISSILAHELNLPGIHPKMSLLSQQKYYSRQIQKEIVPESVPEFFVIDLEDSEIKNDFDYPFFIKPVKSIFSVDAQIVNSDEQLQKIKKAKNYNDFIYPFDYFLKKYSGFETGSKQLIAEGLLKGHQVTVDGYVYKKSIHILGVVDSIMFENTHSFKRFEYPSKLPQSVQKRMHEIVKLVIKKFEYDHCLFNIELMYDPIKDAIYIIEMHPRMSSQFADLFEKVDKTNSYSILIDILNDNMPNKFSKKGKYKVAASCVLRIFQNQYVHEVPSKDEIEKLYSLIPDIRIEIHAHKNTKLSNKRQDTQSYRYGILNIGGRDHQDILEIFDECCKLLTFKFSPC